MHLYSIAVSQFTFCALKDGNAMQLKNLIAWTEKMHHHLAVSFYCSMLFYSFIKISVLFSSDHEGSSTYFTDSHEQTKLNCPLDFACDRFSLASRSFILKHGTGWGDIRYCACAHIIWEMYDTDLFYDTLTNSHEQTKLNCLLGFASNRFSL